MLSVWICLRVWPWKSRLCFVQFNKDETWRTLILKLRQAWTWWTSNWWRKYRQQQQSISDKCFPFFSTKKKVAKASFCLTLSVFMGPDLILISHQVKGWNVKRQISSYLIKTIKTGQGSRGSTLIFQILDIAIRIWSPAPTHSFVLFELHQFEINELLKLILFQNIWTVRRHQKH